MADEKNTSTAKSNLVYEEKNYILFVINESSCNVTSDNLCRCILARKEVTISSVRKTQPELWHGREMGTVRIANLWHLMVVGEIPATSGGRMNATPNSNTACKSACNPF
jgi:hypothetical protein